MLSMKNVVSSACNSKVTPVLFSLKNEESYFGIQVECLVFTSYAVKEIIENVLKGWDLVKLLFFLEGIKRKYPKTEATVESIKSQKIN